VRPDLGEKELAAVKRVFASGNLVQGREVAQLESRICELTGARHAVAVSSGTAALHICFLALDLAPGDLVFVPSFAWPAAANIALITRALPILVDVCQGTYNIDPASLRHRIEYSLENDLGRPRLVVPVHQFGLPCDIESVLTIAEQYRLEVIEDAACALGAFHAGRSVGTFGLMGLFSLHPRKSVTTGEGGMIVTDRSELAQRCRALRSHGCAPDSEFETPGLNYRMTEMQAAVGNIQLAGEENGGELTPGPGGRGLDYVLKKRRTAAERYFAELRSCPGVVLPEVSPEHTWQTFMLTLPLSEHGIGAVNDNSAFHRNRVIESLCDSYGVEACIGSVDTHSLSLYQRQPGWMSLPVSRQLAACGLAMPLYPGMTDADVNYCARALAGTLIQLAESCCD
jgi:dTDP-4-amino-4,6-dideoxygalactose transaminase